MMFDAEAIVGSYGGALKYQSWLLKTFKNNTALFKTLPIRN